MGETPQKTAAAKQRKRPSGKPFIKGQSGNPKGRPKGVQNKATREIQSIAQSLTTGNPKYIKNLQTRAESGKLAPAVEVALLAYAHGKPKEQIELTGKDGGPVETFQKVVLYMPRNGR